MNKSQEIIRFRTAYGAHDPEKYAFCTDPVSMTHQSEAPACDINEIMARFQKTGVLEHKNNFQGQYGDFTELPTDYHSSVNAVIAADQMFATLPSSIRKKFANDPGNFLEFVGDPENAEEMVKLGLANAPVTEKTTKVDQALADTAKAAEEASQAASHTTKEAKTD